VKTEHIAAFAKREQPRRRPRSRRPAPRPRRASRRGGVHQIRRFGGTSRETAFDRRGPPRRDPVGHRVSRRSSARTRRLASARVHRAGEFPNTPSAKHLARTPRERRRLMMAARVRGRPRRRPGARQRRSMTTHRRATRISSMVRMAALRSWIRRPTVGGMGRHRVDHRAGREPRASVPRGIPPMVPSAYGSHYGEPSPVEARGRGIRPRVRERRPRAGRSRRGAMMPRTVSAAIGSAAPVRRSHPPRVT